MKFTRYPSIENTYRQDFIDKVVLENKASGVWVVTEKIHGANFSLLCTGRVVRIAKRSCLLPDDSEFYGIRPVLKRDRLVIKMRQLYDLLSLTINPIGQITVYGELYGGVYNHPDVARNLDARKVQKGVDYSPDNHFIAFDIKVDGSFLDFEKMQAVCREVEMPCIPALMYGTMEACLEHKNDFPSTVSGWYGLPQIEGNICEGIVIRPCQPRFIFNNSRVILKSKNEKFSEKNRGAKVKRARQKMSKQAEKVVKHLSKYVVDNRYDAVVSQFGYPTPKDFGKLQGLFAKDVLVEFAKDKKYKRYTQLDKAERKAINKLLNYMVAKVIKKKLIMGG